MQDAPERLGVAGRALWDSIAGSYALRPDELRALEDAARIADVVALLEAEAADAPTMVKGSMGQPVLNPLIEQQKSHRMAIAGLLSKLKLPDADEGAGESNQHRSAAQSRWARPRGA